MPPKAIPQSALASYDLHKVHIPRISLEGPNSYRPMKTARTERRLRDRLLTRAEQNRRAARRDDEASPCSGDMRGFTWSCTNQLIFKKSSVGRCHGEEAQKSTIVCFLSAKQCQQGTESMHMPNPEFPVRECNPVGTEI